MLRAKATGSPWFPIFQHAMVHGLLMCAWTWWSVGFVAGGLTYCIVLPTHFGIDVLKGKLNVWYPNLRDHANPYYWYVFGADQLLHTLVILIVYRITSHL